MMKVLVTDGHLKAALAAVRTLGRQGFEVHTTQNQPGPTVCSLSTFCHRSHVLPRYQEEEQFDTQFLQLLVREKFTYLLLTSEGALSRISANRGAIRQFTRVDLPPQITVDLILSKTGLLDFAEKIHIPVPNTVFFNRSDPIEKILSALSFPMVVKTGGARGSYDRVRYINNLGELRSYLAGLDPNDAAIFQEYIDGPGYGFSALFENGKPLLYQLHERIWEYPITGGPSVFARTVDDSVLQELGIRLLERLQWNGLAMVEFKKSRVDDQYRLMEVNPRLWGSLDLSIAAGADFPYIAVQTNRNQLANSITVQKVSFLWVFPDAVLFLLACPSQFLRFCRLLFSPQVQKSICLDDLKPLFLQLKEILFWLKTLVPQGRLKYPHGRPKAADVFSFDLHIHSAFSHDSFSSVRKILKKAQHLKLSAIAITDHESLNGGKKAQELNHNPHLTVIVGSEIRTEIGDIIGLFLEKEIRSRSALEVIQEIKAQGGLVMLPHPFSYGITECDEDILRHIDLIELRNARNFREQIGRVFEYTRKYNITLVGNSDAHFVSEIGLTHNVASRRPQSLDDLRVLIRSGNFRLVHAKTDLYRYPLSQTIKAFKQKRYRKLLFYAWWFCKSVVKNTLTRLIDIDSEEVERANRR